jgi:DNA-binding winged helix-turn-helix (wHTH) protein
MLSGLNLRIGVYNMSQRKRLKIMNRAVIHDVLRFDRFSLDLTRGCVRVDEEDVELRPKAFEVLGYLAKNAGRLVTKKELYEAVWPNVIVSDDSIAQCIRQLRNKLGDRDHSLIKTVSRRGYLLDATVLAEAPQRLADGPLEAPREQLGSPQRLSTIPVHKLGAWAAVALVLLSAGWWTTTMLAWRPITLAAQPALETAQTEGQFDGIWRVEYANNDFCVEKSRIRLWAVKQGAIKGGKSEGTVSNTGEVRVTWPDLIDPTLTCVGSAKLQGGRGEGKWKSPRACGGVLTLTQVSGP